MSHEQPITGRWKHMRTGLIFDAADGLNMRQTHNGAYIPAVIYRNVKTDQEAVRSREDFLLKFEPMEGQYGKKR